MSPAVLAERLVAVAFAAAMISAQSPAEPVPALFLDLGPTASSPEARTRTGIADPGPVLAGAPRMRVQLPDRGPLIIERSQVRRRGPDSATWYGTVRGEADSRVILTVEDGILAGSLHTSGAEYQLLPESDERHALLRFDHTSGPLCLTESRPTRLRLPDAYPAPRADDDGTTTIDILVLYSPAVAERQGGRRARAAVRNFVDGANVAFEASEMSVRLRLLDVLPSPVSDGRGSPLDPFARDGRVQELRTRYGADLVSLVHNGPERCGRAYVLQDLNDEVGREGYSSLAYNCGTRTFIHEVGHNLGFQHDPEWGGTDYPSVSPLAYGHWEQGVFRTIMTNSGCSCSSILNFSNPRVTFGPGDSPTGIEGERDNAMVGAVTTPFVADYRPSRFLFDDTFDSGDLDAWRRVRGSLPLVDLAPFEAGFALGVPLGESSRPAWAMHPVRGRPGELQVEMALSIRHGKLRANQEVELLRLMWRNRVHTKVVLRRAGAHRLIVYTLVDGDFVEAASVRIRPQRPEHLSIFWRRASAPDDEDGSIALLRDGRPVGDLTGLANGVWDVSQIRVGLPDGLEDDAGRGTLRIDDYSVRMPPAPEAGAR